MGTFDMCNAHKIGSFGHYDTLNTTQYLARVRVRNGVRVRVSVENTLSYFPAKRVKATEYILGILMSNLLLNKYYKTHFRNPELKNGSRSE